MKAAVSMTGKAITSSHYKVDLVSLQAVCEVNYQRLLQLASRGIVGPEGSSEILITEFQGFHSQAQLQVKEQTRYTTLLTLSVTSPLHDWVPLPELSIRMYHDVRMAEVIAANNYRNLSIHYAYPNPAMHQPDEKHQINRLLAEWLEHCLFIKRTTPFPATKRLSI